MIAAQIHQAKPVRTRDEVVQGKAPVRPVIETALTENHHAFLRFLTRRLGNRSTAEDVLQNFFLRAVRKADEVRDNDSVIAWLYSVLRSVLMDHYRSETARKRREEAYVQEQLLFGDQSEDMPMEDSLCKCFQKLISALRPDYSEILQRIDLAGEAREAVAVDLGITPANARVRLHRARQALRKELDNSCGSCCEQSFRDCSCGRGNHKSDPAQESNSCLH
uniref:RNA polymerase sigma factor n=1 Tax=Pararhizobium sp. IMCC3301 TaxID=3067904 RepID=UPI0027404D0C|nr:sigma-70 family RNA polymerase sigma factor [Pararhizobium sp. IMCC3301]